MFHDIPLPVQAQMLRLEQIDAQDRINGTPRLQRLRQIPAETGRFIALLASSAPEGAYIEIGTSAGYSGMWLALACRAAGRRLITFEASPDRARMAAETFSQAGVGDVVSWRVGDAREYLEEFSEIGFCFLDADKEVYSDCYEMVVPRMRCGGILVADNAISHQTALQPFLDRVLSDERVDGLVVPIGRGELVCRKR